MGNYLDALMFMVGLVLIIFGGYMSIIPNWFYFVGNILLLVGVLTVYGSIHSYLKFSLSNIQIMITSALFVLVGLLFRLYPLTNFLGIIFLVLGAYIFIRVLFITLMNSRRPKT